jgi:hypothetical protein
MCQFGDRLPGKQVEFRDFSEVILVSIKISDLSVPFLLSKGIMHKFETETN